MFISLLIKEKLGVLSSIRDHRKKVQKQGRSPTPADILLDYGTAHFEVY